MKTKPLNQIIDECIKYTRQVILGSESHKYCSRFLRYPGSYTISCDLLKIANLCSEERRVLRRFFKIYMNDRRFKV